MEQEYLPSAPIEESNPSAPEQELSTAGCKSLDIERKICKENSKLLQNSTAD